ncbi:hypothetical protein [Spiroplasma endosymbiont of Polydrusus formosus]|uniref:hypothetical protein n=1 Tax=Spiroplasma endosymbiont of Polydrusus formosus TaxID=3139326 RepID=UPI0035B53092
MPTKISCNNGLDFVLLIKIDENDNVYFHTANNGDCILKNNEIITTKINNNIFNNEKNNINTIYAIISSVVDKNGNIYCITISDFWFLKNKLLINSNIKKLNLK